MTPQPLGRRLVGFLAIPAIAAASPLIVLPFVSRNAGPAGWASAIAGESVGTLAAIAIGYGWASIGPAMVSVAGEDTRRARIYRDSIAVRLLLAMVVLPALAVVCWFVASPGFEWLSVLMGTQGALIALSFTWYCAGVGDPRTIIVFDAVPRLIATVVAAGAIAATGVVELYPMAGILVTLGGTTLFTWRLLRRNPGPWPTAREIPGLMRKGAPVALNDAALSGYSSLPAPLVNVTSPPVAAAGFASAEKMLKLGQFLPMTLANAFQSWVAETDGAGRRRRILLALAVLIAGGLAGWAGLAFLGPWVSTVLFGEDAAMMRRALLMTHLIMRHELLPAADVRLLSNLQHVRERRGRFRSALLKARPLFFGTASGLNSFVRRRLSHAPVACRVALFILNDLLRS